MLVAYAVLMTGLWFRRERTETEDFRPSPEAFCLTNWHLSASDKRALMHAYDSAEPAFTARHEALLHSIARVIVSIDQRPFNPQQLRTAIEQAYQDKIVWDNISIEAFMSAMTQLSEDGRRNFVSQYLLKRS
jgi:hypothetical protein